MTKEKALLLLIAISMLVIVILPTTANATRGEENWTDLTNAKVEIIGESTDKKDSIEDATLITYKVKISNVTLNQESEYLVYFHYKDEEITRDKVLFHNHALIEKGSNEAIINAVWIQYFLQRNEDIYVSVLERKKVESDTKTNLAITARKMERPEQLPKLGNRFSIYFSNSVTPFFFWAPNSDTHGNYIDRKVKIKIGQVTDTELLKSIKANKAQGYTKLLDYAKKATKYNYIGTIQYTGKTGAGSYVPTSEMNLADGAYYFAYIELDDENGLYYPVEDIALYRAKGTKDLVRYPDKEFVWEIAEETKKPIEEAPKPEKPKKEQPAQKTEDNTTAKESLPQTGEKAILSVVVVFAVLTGIGYVKYKKYQDIK